MLVWVGHCLSAEKFEAVAHLEQARRTDGNGNQQHQSLEQRLPQRVEIEDEQQIADGTEGQRPRRSRRWR